jgi:very-short-patch-repair endonuclease
MPGRRNHDPRLLGFARTMRSQGTDAERKLWWILRIRKLDGYDEQRTRRLEELGLRVIRFWDPDVLKHPNEVAESIYRALSGG